MGTDYQQRETEKESVSYWKHSKPEDDKMIFLKC